MLFLRTLFAVELAFISALVYDYLRSMHMLPESMVQLYGLIRFVIFGLVVTCVFLLTRNLGVLGTKVQNWTKLLVSNDVQLVIAVPILLLLIKGITNTFIELSVKDVLLLILYLTCCFIWYKCIRNINNIKSISI